MTVFDDNASMGLDPSALSGKTTPVRLDLSCGHYYLSQIDTTQNLAIVARGKVALYIDGDVTTAGLSLVPDPGAELDIFVKGDVLATGPVYIGSPQYSAVTRLYVNGGGDFSIGPDAPRWQSLRSERHRVARERGTPEPSPTQPRCVCTTTTASPRRARRPFADICPASTLFSASPSTSSLSPR